MHADKILPDIIRRLRSLPFEVSRPRAALFGVTLIVVGIAMGGLKPAPSPGEPGFTHILDLDLPYRLGPATEAALPVAAATPQPAPEEDRWEIVTVRAGQSLDAIFRQQGFSSALLQDILALNDETRSLKTIRPGDEFAFRRDASGNLEQMRYPLDEGRYLLVDASDETPRAEILIRQLSTRLFEAEGSIDSSLFLAGKAAGLSDNMIMKLANIFGWDIDFVLDIRAGDRFFLLYEKIYRDGDYLRDGEILAATFVNQGDKYQAIRFASDNGPQYYAPDGRHMRKAFLRAPLNFSYISSSFNPRRFHPILKRIKAHNGIDYRAPRGTPVYAAGDGRVIKSARDQYNGHHVFIQHANSIVTKYLHFTNRTVKQGERVRQGQVIGYVGSTGLAEAPHLHYEFVVNGVHRNPRTVSLPTVEPLQGTQLQAFRQHAAPYLKQLGRLESASLYASTE